jgi:uncharacterized protein YbjT (DUF2867 family)
VEAIRHTGKLFGPADGARIAMIDPRDVAVVTAVVLTTDGHEGQTYPWNLRLWECSAYLS